MVWLSLGGSRDMSCMCWDQNPTTLLPVIQICHTSTMQIFCLTYLILPPIFTGSTRYGGRMFCP